MTEFWKTIVIVLAQGVVSFLLWHVIFWFLIFRKKYQNCLNYCKDLEIANAQTSIEVKELKRQLLLVRCGFENIAGRLSNSKLFMDER